MYLIYFQLFKINIYTLKIKKGEISPIRFGVFPFKNYNNKTYIWSIKKKI